jgi:thiol-disulfide isomerase/thioredoxin
MSDLPEADAPLLVACLCAAWCRTCDDYRVTFDTLAREFGARTRFVWVDIEDEEDALGTVDVVDFPTLLIARAEQTRFFGPVMPQPHAARQLVQRALKDELGAVTDAALAGLPARLRALA